jgi:hypothetical protein
MVIYASPKRLSTPTIGSLIHPSAWKRNSAKLARGLLEWHHGRGGKGTASRGGGRRRRQPVSEDRSQQNTDAAEEALAVREEADGQEPDVLLDVSELEVDRINLEVEDLRAHVSILAELANLLSLSVGVDARLDRVKLEIEGVEAKVLLKVRLKHVRAILEKALETIAENPEILRILARTLSRVVRESLGETLGTLNEVLEGLEVEDTVDEVLRGRLEEVRSTLEEILERSERGGRGSCTEKVG